MTKSYSKIEPTREKYKHFKQIWLINYSNYNNNNNKIIFRHHITKSTIKTKMLHVVKTSS